MWFTKALVAYDGSSPSAKAIDLARGMAAQDPNMEFVFVHVMKLMALGTGAEGVLIEEANRVYGVLQDIAASLPNKAHAHLLKGSSPADLILKCAHDEGCDLIIMGSRGMGGVRGYLGSVSHGVVQGSPVTVLIAKGAPEAEAGAGAGAGAPGAQGSQTEGADATGAGAAASGERTAR